MRDRKAEGFTLVEVLALLAVLGIISTFVIRGVGTTTPRMVVEQEATRVTSTIARARAVAMTEQRRTRVDVIGGRQLRIQRMVRGAWSPEPPAKVAEGVRLRINGRASGSLVFLPTGAVRAPATIDVNGATRAETVAIWASGTTKRSRR